MGPVSDPNPRFRRASQSRSLALSDGALGKTRWEAHPHGPVKMTLPSAISRVERLQRQHTSGEVPREFERGATGFAEAKIIKWQPKPPGCASRQSQGKTQARRRDTAGLRLDIRTATQERMEWQSNSTAAAPRG